MYITCPLITCFVSLFSVTETVKPSLNPDVTITEKDDIEDILTYFNIKQNKQVVERQNAELQEDKNRQQSARAIGEKRDDNCVIDLASIETEAKPVFIEIATDQEQPNGTGSGSDCLMVLESVQVDLDPNELMLPEKGVEIEEDEEDVIVICDKPDDPISLLTSSDEDDVIIQEPRIETVEVSDETDEDDVPLVKLIKTKSKKKKKKRLNPFSRKNTWGDYLYNCMDCQYRSDSKLEYEEHVTTHSTLIYMCHICEYITASKVLFNNHQKKHKEDKRYECHLCGYKARHKLSLTYHMKSHNSVSDGVESDSKIPKSDSDSTKRRGSRRKKPK
ncbi:unnamed protein product [Parnassius mnemosyne]|uniref:C2H2-type domain-containing protein n=1 Tax=Parnassius mnemosyne TaxID=213953 RepID=A0AAV1KXY9_9NEOP